jgi:dolichol-phosphate mannosyltransferase
MTYRARSNGATIIEVPIAFKDREFGESKMSKAIVVEALGLVTRWAIEKQLRRLRR